MKLFLYGLLLINLNLFGAQATDDKKHFAPFPQDLLTLNSQQQEPAGARAQRQEQQPVQAQQEEKEDAEILFLFDVGWAGSSSTNRLSVKCNSKLTVKEIFGFFRRILNIKGSQYLTLFYNSCMCFDETCTWGNFDWCMIDLASGDQPFLLLICDWKK